MTKEEEIKSNAEIVQEAIREHISVIQSVSPVLDGRNESEITELIMMMLMLMGPPGDNKLRRSWDRTQAVIENGFHAYKIYNDLT
jgi:hypothetical protein